MVNKLKLLSNTRLKLEKTSIRFKTKLEEERVFFSIPLDIQLIVSTSLSKLDLITHNTLNGGFTSQQTKDFIKTDIISKNILSFTSNHINNKILSNIIISCLNNNIDFSVFPENLNNNELLNNINNLNDIDNKIDSNEILKLENKIKNANLTFQNISLSIIASLQKINTEKNTNSIKNKIDEEIEKIKRLQLNNEIISYKYMLQHIIYITKDLFQRTLYPSFNRTKYIQQLLRNLYGLIKNKYNIINPIINIELGSIENEIEKLLVSLKNIDNILIAITFLSTLYINNRLTLRKLSKQTLKEISAEKQCNIPNLEEFDVSINYYPLNITPICPITKDDIIVPHIPFEQKLENISCEIQLNEEIDPSIGLKINLVTHAIIENKRTIDKLTPFVTIGSFVDQDTIVASINQTSIYSPVQGFVDEIDTNLIVIRDIEEPGENLLESQINLLNQKYNRLNDIKSFIKNFKILSLYPIMLSISASKATSSIFLGIDDEYRRIKRNFKRLNDNYEKTIKQHTGKDNVEKHAKNETLYNIKENLDKEEKKFFKYIKLLQDRAINISKRTQARSKEYELFEYYSINLGLKLNGLDTPTDIEKEFRNTINEFIRKRIVVDKYNKNKLKDKINSLIKDLEKGISIGNWFNKALQVYNTNKKISELKTWLEGLANKNNKLEQVEKIELINSILFLFELYLDYNTIIQKYNIIKQETAIKKETIKEGNTILSYIQNLWKEYESLPEEISKIENLIENLSLFSTYSIGTWKGYESRLYTLVDIPNCPQDLNKDPYISPNSQYGFGDIQYWLKYCSFATLASVTNPATGWSTGWITPAPILFPVIYIPFKSIPTISGFIVLGITICGIFISPFSLFVNLSTNFNVPFIDPTAALKREIQTLKKEISEGLQNLREISIRPLMNQTRDDIGNIKLLIRDYRQQIINNKNIKPIRYFREINNNFQNIIKENINYINEFTRWAQRNVELNELLLTQQINLFTLQSKYRILRNALVLGRSLEGTTDELIQTEKFLNNQLNSLTKLVENINLNLALLPISLDPQSANFGITLKNPRPIINIARELDNNINDNVLDEITSATRLKNSDLISIDYNNKISDSIINYKKYITILSDAMNLLIEKDAFPKYENLRLTNLRWMSFLYMDFVVIGARTYGFPGNLPLPL